MTYNFVAIPDNFKRLFWGVIADSRANIPAILNTDGWAIKAYVDSQIALVTPDVVPYGIWTNQGVLAGYMGIFVGNGPVSIALQQLRPAFTGFYTEISNALINFILSGAFAYDFLN